MEKWRKEKKCWWNSNSKSDNEAEDSKVEMLILGWGPASKHEVLSSNPNTTKKILGLNFQANVPHPFKTQRSGGGRDVGDLEGVAEGAPVVPWTVFLLSMVLTAQVSNSQWDWKMAQKRVWQFLH
jgi:hypothetical protein